MKDGRPSATAQRVAMHRAAHQLLDRPRVLEDPIALRIIGARARVTLEADPGRFERSRIAPYLRAFLAARSRLAEEELADAVARVGSLACMIVAEVARPADERAE